MNQKNLMFMASGVLLIAIVILTSSGSSYYVEGLENKDKKSSCSCNKKPYLF